MSEKLKLSRRKMLAGLGTIGIASGAAGYGTYAAFNDEETQNTTFTAGELDLRVSYRASYNGAQVAKDDDDDDSKAIELDPTEEDGQVALSISDVKPGDVGSLNFTIETTSNSNDAWVLSQLNVASSTDGTVTEPEAQVDDDFEDLDLDEDELPDNSSKPGELQYFLEFIGFYDSNDKSNFFDSSGDEPSYDFDGNTPGVPAEFYDNADEGNGYVARTLNDLATQDLQQGTNSHVDVTDEDSDYTGAVIVDGNPKPPTENIQNTALDTLDSGDSVNFGYDWHLPYQTGNAVQGDTIDIEFTFIAIQDRFSQLPENADNFFNPADGTNSGNAETTTTPEN